MFPFSYIGALKGLGGKFKHLQHPGTYKEDCEYRITTKTHLAVKISFEKPVPCEKARVKGWYYKKFKEVIRPKFFLAFRFLNVKKTYPLSH